MGMHKLFNDDYSGEVGKERKTNQDLNFIKNYLISKDWGTALELLKLLENRNPLQLDRWLRIKSTLLLMKMCEPFRDYSIYNHRTDALPFDNDIAALDSASVKLNHQPK